MSIYNPVGINHHYNQIIWTLSSSSLDLSMTLIVSISLQKPRRSQDVHCSIQFFCADCVKTI